jgi:putative phosphoesterase
MKLGVVLDTHGYPRNPKARNTVAVKIGMVSDTHGFFDPRLAELLEGVEVILHGGDVGSLPVLDELRRIAEVDAVRGNVDSPALGLPPSLTRRFAGVQIEMKHILPVPQSKLEQWAREAVPSKDQAARREAFLGNFEPATRVVIFGHSHEPCLLVLGGKLFINPGSAGRRRFSLPRCCGLAEISPVAITATIQLLERYNGKVPVDIQLDLEPSRPR